MASRFAERQNEYFIPGDGISREVIQADICRYLGNDALVRPGTHNGRTGYFIRAYRNLTTEMIADLKADSARWEQEMSRREHMGYSRVTYAASNTYESRQQQQQLPHQQQQQGGPSPPPYNATPVYMEPGFSPAAYGVQNVPYQANSGAYAHAGVYQATTQPGYGQAPLVYASQPQQTYTIPTQTPVSSPGSMDQYQYAIHGGGQAAYGHETARNAAHAAPRTTYVSPSFDPSEPDRIVVANTSAQNYPAATTGTDRTMEPRFAPENYQQDHRSAPARTRQTGEGGRRGGR